MPFLFIWTVVEILIFSRFVESFGFAQSFLAYVLPSFLGIFWLARFKNYGWGQLQATWQQGKEPTVEILHITAQILGAVLLLPPSFITRIVGLILILPGTRHLCVTVIKIYFVQRLMRHGPRIFKSGAFTFYSSTRGFNTEQPQERDAEIIDIQPIQVEHTLKKKD